ncbi:MAG TPA: S66 peptidase family protein [Clostridia bacterium]|nr:S66 peptidase family protein [Clostridia bacterium]
MLRSGDKVGIVACSNAQMRSDEAQIAELAETLAKLGLAPVFSRHIYEVRPAFSGNARERAAALTEFYADKSIQAIFDISGGDLANELLEFLDYNLIRNAQKPFWGYSDLTAIINAIYTKAGVPSFLYQVKNLVWDDKKNQIERFKNTVLHGQSDLTDITWSFLQGTKMKGIVIGGNIRCFLKLAGTPYMPDFQNKILFLESLSGSAVSMTARLCQLRQLGAFKNIAGLLLGTFTKLEAIKEAPQIEELVLSIVDDPSLPIAKTREVGHDNTSKCLVIGQEYSVER